MKLVKSLLLGSAAGLCAAAGAQAADLPVRKAAPVEYVRVCTAYGAGFFYIPGTDICLRVGGRARADLDYINQRNRANSTSGWRGELKLSMDARNETPYGTLRTFVRLQVASRTGAYQRSGTQERQAAAFFGTGVDQFGQNQRYVEVDKAFIQFGGFTAGRASSFYDFYAGDIELIQSGIYSVGGSSINLFAYTATLGNGFSATISVEDPVQRREPTFGFSPGIGTAANTNAGIATGSSSFYVGQGSVTPIGITTFANGVPITAQNVDVTQKNQTPDFVANVRYDAPWGALQVSAASHELRVNSPSGGVFATATGAAAVVPGAAVALHDADYGFAVQGGAKFNLPQIAPGDTLWLQAAYAEGANNYTGVTDNQGSFIGTNSNTNRFSGNNAFNQWDYAITTDGRSHLTQSWSVSATYLHYWSPEWRSAIFGNYGQANFDNALRGPTSPAIGTFFSPTTGAAVSGFTPGTNVPRALGQFSGTFKDWETIYVGANLIWSPVKDLDIGVEGVYNRLQFMGGANARVFDQNKNNGKLSSFDDQAHFRLRVQRDF